MVGFLRSRGFRVFHRSPPIVPVEEFEKPEEIPSDRGRYYTRIGRDLYVYVRERGDLIDPDEFPAEAGLFGPESSWRLNAWMAIVKGADEWGLDRAEMTLVACGYERREPPREALERYFAVGDFAILENLVG